MSCLLRGPLVPGELTVETAPEVLIESHHTTTTARLCGAGALKYWLLHSSPLV